MSGDKVRDAQENGTLRNLHWGNRVSVRCRHRWKSILRDSCRVWKQHSEESGLEYKGHYLICHVSEECSGCKNALSRGVDEVGRADGLGVNELSGIGITKTGKGAWAQKEKSGIGG